MNLTNIKMAPENKKANALKIGFLDEKAEENMKYYEEAFDIVCTNNTTYTELVGKVSILKSTHN